MAAEEGPTWRYVALGSITLVFSLAGYLIGNFISGVRNELASIHQILDNRSSVAPRLEAVERIILDQETRLRVVEQDHWRDEKKKE